MDNVILNITPDPERCRPGGEISGRVNWMLDKPMKSGEVRLVWSTRGKGSEDKEIVDRLEIANPVQSGEFPFRFRLPSGPYSFSGKLISLVWMIEVQIKPSKLTKDAEFVMSPTGKEIIIADAGG